MSKHFFTKAQSLVYEAQAYSRSTNVFLTKRVRFFTPLQEAQAIFYKAQTILHARPLHEINVSQSKRSTTTRKQQNKDKQKHKEQHRTHAPKKLKTEIMMCHYLSITTLKERLISSRPGTRKRTHPEASCRKVTC